MMTPAEHGEWNGLREHLGLVLSSAQSKRDLRRTIDPITGQPGWIAHEVGVMHDAVNRLRRPGVPEVTRAAVERADQMAAGHIDYSSKFALYCADLAWGRSTILP